MFMLSDCVDLVQQSSQIKESAVKNKRIFDRTFLRKIIYVGFSKKEKNTKALYIEYIMSLVKQTV